MAEYTGVGPFFWQPATVGQGAQNNATKNAAAANNTLSVISVAAGAATAKLLWVPAITSTTAYTEGTGQNKGWNFLVADFDTTANLPGGRLIRNGDVITFAISVASNQALTSINPAVDIYKRSSAGVLTEIGRSGNVALNFTVASTQTGTVTFTFTSDTIFLAGETIHTEVYCTQFGSNALAVTTFGLQNTAAFGKYDFTTGTGLRYNYPRSLTTALTLTGVKGVRVVAKFFTTALTLTGVKGVRTVTKGTPFVAALSLLGVLGVRTVGKPFTTALTLTGTMTKVFGAFRSFTTALSLTGVLGIRTVAKAFTTALTLTGVASRKITAFRSFTTALTLGTVFARFITSVRSFTTALSLVADGALNISFAIERRITGGGGGTTIIKKLFIFDD